MATFSTLPAELRREIIIHAVDVRRRQFWRMLRLRLVNKEFAHEARDATLSFSHHDNEQLWVKQGEWDRYPDMILREPEYNSPEYSAFWLPYLTNRIIRKKWKDAELCEQVYRTAQRLCEISHPQETSQETLREISRQYVGAYCRHFTRMRCRRRKKFYKAWPSHESFLLLQMALLNNCQEGVKCALEDPVLSETMLHSTLQNTWVPYRIAPLAGQSGDISLLANIFSNTYLDRKGDSQHVRIQAFGAAVAAARLDAIKFMLKYPKVLSWNEDRRWNRWSDSELVSGMLKSESADFCSQLFELQSPHPEDRRKLEALFDYSRLLRLVVQASPQRVDVAEWLLKQGASAEQLSEESMFLRHWYKSRAWRDALGCAIVGGNEQMVRLLLSHGADARVYEKQYTEDAATRGRLDIMRMLVEHGACITARVPSTRPEEEEQKWKEDRLMTSAVHTENEELCRYLVELGAIINDSAMKAAIGRELISMVRLLLDFGADATAENVYRARGSPEIPDLLLEARYNALCN